MRLGFGLAHRSRQFLAISTKNMERETGIEPATFSLGNYDPIGNKRLLRFMATFPATDNKGVKRFLQKTE